MTSTEHQNSALGTASLADGHQDGISAHNNRLNTERNGEQEENWDDITRKNTIQNERDKLLERTADLLVQPVPISTNKIAASKRVGFKNGSYFWQKEKELVSKHVYYSPLAQRREPSRRPVRPVPAQVVFGPNRASSQWNGRARDAPAGEPSLASLARPVVVSARSRKNAICR